MTLTHTGSQRLSGCTNIANATAAAIGKIKRRKLQPHHEVRIDQAATHLEAALAIISQLARESLGEYRGNGNGGNS